MKTKNSLNVIILNAASLVWLFYNILMLCIAIQRIAARRYLATTTFNPLCWGTLWGGELDAEIEFVGTQKLTKILIFFKI